MSNPDAPTDFETLCAGYVLGVLSADEAAQFEAMLKDATPEQRALYRDLMQVQADLSLATVPESPPAWVEDRLMASIQEDAGAAERAAPAREAPAAQPSTRRAADRAADRAPKRRAPSLPVWIYQSVAVALLIAVVGLGYWAADLRSTVQEQETVITQLESEVAQQEELLAVLAAREARLVSMGGLDPSPDGYGKIVWAPDQRRAIVQMANLPPPPNDKDYQLWLIKDDQSPISAGVFHFEESASDLFFVVEELAETPSPTSNTFAVTLEPKGGAPQPSGDMFLMGQQT